MTYFNKDHKRLEPGSQEWRDGVPNYQRSLEERIETLEERCAVLARFGARM